MPVYMQALIKVPVGHVLFETSISLIAIARVLHHYLISTFKPIISYEYNAFSIEI